MKKLTFAHWIISLVVFILFCGFILPYIDFVTTDAIRTYDFSKNVIIFDEVALARLQNIQGSTTISPMIHLFVDVLWPLVYTSYFFISLHLIFRKSNYLYKNILLVLPFIILGLDFIQSFTTTLFIEQGNNSFLLQTISVIATLRWFLIYGCIGFMAYGLFIYLKKATLKQLGYDSHN